MPLLTWAGSPLPRPAGAEALAKPFPPETGLCAGTGSRRVGPDDLRPSVSPGQCLLCVPQAGEARGSPSGPCSRFSLKTAPVLLFFKLEARFLHQWGSPAGPAGIRLTPALGHPPRGPQLREGSSPVLHPANGSLLSASASGMSARNAAATSLQLQLLWSVCPLVASARHSSFCIRIDWDGTGGDDMGFRCIVLGYSMSVCVHHPTSVESSSLTAYPLPLLLLKSFCG